MEQGPFIKSAIERGNLFLDAMKGNERRNKFVFAVNGDHYGTALVKSVGPNKIRLFRGFQIKQGNTFAPLQDKKYSKILGIQSCFLAVYDEDQGLIDKIDFKAKITKDMDAVVYHVRMETISVLIQNIV